MVKYLFFYLFFVYTLCSQHALFPPDYFLAHQTFYHLFKPSDSIHPTVFPLNELQGKTYRYVVDSTRLFPEISWDEGIDFVFYNPLLNIKPKNEPVQITVNPVLHLFTGFNNADSIRYRYRNNSRGIVGNIRIKDKVFIETFFVENQSFFPYYLQAFATQSKIIPGQGRYKNFKNSGFDYAFAAGLISFQPTPNFNIQAGHFKNKIGCGYRSVLLSDQAFLYPQIKLTQLFFKQKLQYTYWAASLMDLDSAYTIGIPGLERLFRKKPLCMQYVHVNLHPNIKAGLFQSVTGSTNDGQNRMTVGGDFFNPVPLIWPVVKNFNPSSHILWGTDLLIIPLKGIQIYAQYALRNDSNGKMNLALNAYQVGVRYIYKSKTNLGGMVFAEYNEISKNFYDKTRNFRYHASYAQYGESMGFSSLIQSELAIGSIIMKNRWGWQFLYLYQNPNLVHSGSIQHVKNEWYYLLNRSSLLTLFISHHYRFHDFPNFTLQQNTLQWWNIGIRTRIYSVFNEF